MYYFISEIRWDTDGDNKLAASLPQSFCVPVPGHIHEGEETLEYISDYITQETGFCHKGFSWTDINALHISLPHLKGDLIVDATLQNERCPGISVAFKPWHSDTEYQMDLIEAPADDDKSVHLLHYAGPEDKKAAYEVFFRVPKCEEEV